MSIEAEPYDVFFSFRRCARWRDLGALMAAAAIENLGIRLLQAWRRLEGSYRALRSVRPDWGAMPRTELAGEADPVIS